MAHTYIGRSQRSRASGFSPSMASFCAYAAYAAAFSFSAAIVLGLIG